MSRTDILGISAFYHDSAACLLRNGEFRPMQLGAVRSGTTKRFFWNSMLALGSLGLALVVAEALLRILGISYPVFARVDSVTGVAHIPGRL